MMTLDELSLRVEAAFPCATIRKTKWAVEATFTGPFDLECGSVPISGLEVEAADLCLFITFAYDDTAEDIEMVPVAGDWRMAEEEIRRRILSVTAHQLLAAKHRLMVRSAS